MKVSLARKQAIQTVILIEKAWLCHLAFKLHPYLMLKVRLDSCFLFILCCWLLHLSYLPYVDDPSGNIKFTVTFPGDAVIPDTAPTSPEPAPAADSQLVQKSLLSTFGSNTGSTGIMFDVVAISSIDITAMDLHLRSGADEGEKMIEVYVMSGTHVANASNPEMWGKVCCGKKIVSDLNNVSFGGSGYVSNINLL